MTLDELPGEYEDMKPPIKIPCCPECGTMLSKEQIDGIVYWACWGSCWYISKSNDKQPDWREVVGREYPMEAKDDTES